MRKYQLSQRIQQPSTFNNWFSFSPSPFILFSFYSLPIAHSLPVPLTPFSFPTPFSINPQTVYPTSPFLSFSVSFLVHLKITPLVTLCHFILVRLHNAIVLCGQRLMGGGAPPTRIFEPAGNLLILSASMCNHRQKQWRQKPQKCLSSSTPTLFFINNTGHKLKAQQFFTRHDNREDNIKLSVTTNYSQLLTTHQPPHPTRHSTKLNISH